MPLIVETGTIVTNANSYVTIEDARLYAESRGLALPNDDDKLETYLIQAVDYLESKRERYQGAKVSAGQELQFPREGVQIDGIDLEATAIPSILKQAQIRLAVEIEAGVNIMPTRSGGFVKKEVVGPIETEYSEKVGVSIEPELTAVEALLAPLFGAINVGFFLKTVRV